MASDTMLRIPSTAAPPDAGRCQLPASLQRQLRDYRRRLRIAKITEAAGMTWVVVSGAFVTVWMIDRRWDTPVALRAALLVAIAAVALAIPRAIYRWGWQHRHPHQLARLLGRRLPRCGDALLGVMELTASPSEQARSAALCQAAIDQVARQAAATDFRTALPPSRHRMWIAASAFAAVILATAWVASPDASASAWRRLWAPWQATPRYTFARIRPLPSPMVVPHGEPSALAVALHPRSSWRPRQAQIQIAGQRPLYARRSNNAYRFRIPPQIVASALDVRVGDVTRQIVLRPTLRPELIRLQARITLPAYLQRPLVNELDARSGSVTVVQGSHLQLEIAASRPLQTAHIQDRAYDADGGVVVSGPLRIDDAQTIPITWRDTLGLDQREAFALRVRSIADAPPTLICDGLTDRSTVLDSQTLTFQIRADDDFGIRRVGIQWRPVEPAATADPATGQRALAAGGPMQQRITAAGTFRADALGIPPQPIELRAWAEDFLPGRERVYSPPYRLQVVSSNEHALWLADRLARWYAQALEVRDRELQLHESNKQLRDLAATSDDDAALRERIQRQAAQERESGRRLKDVARSGQQLLTDAARNPEMDAEHLQQWAQTLQVLNEIADNRMPSVADLLSQAAAGADQAAAPPDEPRTMAGQSRAAAPTGADPEADAAADPPQSPMGPKVVDVESTQSPLDAGAAPPLQPAAGPKPLGLAGTTLLGGAAQQTPAASDTGAAAGDLQQAVEAQQQLLREFEQVADQLSGLIANLEGSTLVKRLKAASRQQHRIAGAIASQLQEVFAEVPGATDPAHLARLAELAEQQTGVVQSVSLVMDDMQAYAQRRRQIAVQMVLQQMRKSDVLAGLRTLADEIPRQQGLALADSEYWSDALDRWAEDLVPPAASGQAPGAPPKGSLPPSIVLRVLQVLQGEVDLREATRVADQARGAQSDREYHTAADRLAAEQRELQQRLGQVVADISGLPGGEAAFADDLRTLQGVLPVMDDAATILATPDTGPPAIAAQTEAIELLLKSSRENPGAGGGGGAAAGSGGGDTPAPASPLALIGAGINELEQRRPSDTPQAVGAAEVALPEEYRDGLDEYFNRIER